MTLERGGSGSCLEGRTQRRLRDADSLEPVDHPAIRILLGFVRQPGVETEPEEDELRRWIALLPRALMPFNHQPSYLRLIHSFTLLMSLEVRRPGTPSATR